MYKQYKILAVVGARGGSKGLPGKNIKKLNGEPLIGWTLKSLKYSQYVDEIFVSTDSEEIAEISKQYGVEVPSLRPAFLAEDTSSSIDFMLYTIQVLEVQGKIFDYIILLEPTSPLRKKNDIDEMIKLAGDNPESDGVISVGEVQGEHPAIMKKINQVGKIIPYMESAPEVCRRQEFDDAYFPYGVGYLIKVSKLKEQHTIYTDNILPYYIERWQNYEVDDIYDFVCIERIMQMEVDKI